MATGNSYIIKIRSCYGIHYSYKCYNVMSPYRIGSAAFIYCISRDVVTRFTAAVAINGIFFFFFYGFLDFPLSLYARTYMVIFSTAHIVS